MKKTFPLVAILVATFALAQQGTSPQVTKPALLNDVSNGPVAEVVTDTSATVGWSTKYPGKGSIKYGLDAKNLDQTGTAQQSAEGRNHHAKLTGLKPDTNYFFQVMQNGKPAEEVGTFRTTPQGAKPERSNAVIPQ